jgi:virginiamycin B lyase
MLLSLAVALCGLHALLPAQQVAIANYPVPPTNPYGQGTITPSTDGSLWAPCAGSICILTLSAELTVLPLAKGNYPSGMVQGPADGDFWFTEPNQNLIGRITQQRVVSYYPVPTANSTPSQIVVGSDGALWFTEFTATKIGRITTSGVITEFPLTFSDGYPGGITLGPDGALWFCEWPDGIGRMTTSGAYTRFSIPNPNAAPGNIVTGPDGALWFTEISGDSIGRITTAGAVTEYPVPTLNSEPNGIAAAADGALWFTEFAGNKVGRITTSGVVSEYPVPSVLDQPVYPNTIATGEDGSLWFNTYLNVGQVVFPTAAMTVTPDSASFHTELTFSGSGFAANEEVRILETGLGSTVLVRGTADASGSFTTTVRAPSSVYGPRLFFGKGVQSAKMAAAAFNSTPRLAISPSAGPAGSTATAAGYGFGSLETVKVYWANPKKYLGSVTTDVNGSFTGLDGLTFTVPATAPSGSTTVGAVGQTSKAKGRGAFDVQ